MRQSQEEKKRQHHLELSHKSGMLDALIEVWEKKCRETYSHSNVEYLRDLKKRKRSVEIRIKSLSI